MSTGQRPRRGLPRLGYHGFGALLALASLSVAHPSVRPPCEPPAAPASLGEPAAGAVEAASTLDEPLRLIARARAAYAKVNDYTCLLTKRERMDGRLSPEHLIQMKCKERPFSVYLRWTAPRHLAGQQVCYVAGRHDGQMRAHPNGLLGALGWVTLAVDDARARKTSRHPITSAGVGNLIERLGKAWEEERRLGRAQVRLCVYAYNHLHRTRVVVTRTGPADGRSPHQRTVVLFDPETELPIRLEGYAWPTRPGATGELDELIDYSDLKLNVGLGDEVFDK
jgi:hypothetical protein